MGYIYTIKLSPADRRALWALAGSEARPRSEIVRALIRAAAADLPHEWKQKLELEERYAAQTA